MNIPISLVFHTSTKGHFGFKDMYLDTLNHIDRQIPLAAFSVKVATLKISPDESELGFKMQAELESRGFKVLAQMGEWHRGTSHQLAYLEDQRRASKELSIYQNPYVLMWEDDSPVICHKTSLEATLHRMMTHLESLPDYLTFRFIRRADFDGGVPQLKYDWEYYRKQDPDFFWSPYTDFQPLLIRSRDYYLLHKTIEDNWGLASHVQSEALWAMMLSRFSRSDKNKHAVWYPDYAETIHLGQPDYLNVRKTLNL